jgi:hypothetical protein
MLFFFENVPFKLFLYKKSPKILRNFFFFFMSEKGFQKCQRVDVVTHECYTIKETSSDSININCFFF